MTDTYNPDMYGIGPDGMTTEELLGVISDSYISFPLGLQDPHGRESILKRIKGSTDLLKKTFYTPRLIHLYNTCSPAMQDPKTQMSPLRSLLPSTVPEMTDTLIKLNSVCNSYYDPEIYTLVILLNACKRFKRLDYIPLDGINGIFTFLSKLRNGAKLVLSSYDGQMEWVLTIIYEKGGNEGYKYSFNTFVISDKEKRKYTNVSLYNPGMNQPELHDKVMGAFIYLSDVTMIINQDISDESDDPSLNVQIRKNVFSCNIEGISTTLNDLIFPVTCIAGPVGGLSTLGRNVKDMFKVIKYTKEESGLHRKIFEYSHVLLNIKKGYIDRVIHSSSKLKVDETSTHYLLFDIDGYIPDVVTQAYSMVDDVEVFDYLISEFMTSTGNLYKLNLQLYTPINKVYKVPGEYLKLYRLVNKIYNLNAKMIPSHSPDYGSLETLMSDIPMLEYSLSHNPVGQEGVLHSRNGRMVMIPHLLELGYPSICNGDLMNVIFVDSSIKDSRNLQFMVHLKLGPFDIRVSETGYIERRNLSPKDILPIYAKYNSLGLLKSPIHPVGHDLPDLSGIRDYVMYYLHVYFRSAYVTLTHSTLLDPMAGQGSSLDLISPDMYSYIRGVHPIYMVLITLFHQEDHRISRDGGRPQKDGMGYMKTMIEHLTEQYTIDEMYETINSRVDRWSTYHNLYMINDISLNGTSMEMKVPFKEMSDISYLFTSRQLSIYLGNNEITDTWIRQVRYTTIPIPSKFRIVEDSLHKSSRCGPSAVRIIADYLMNFSIGSKNVEIQVGKISGMYGISVTCNRDISLQTLPKLLLPYIGIYQLFQEKIVKVVYISTFDKNTFRTIGVIAKPELDDIKYQVKLTDPDRHSNSTDLDTRLGKTSVVVIFNQEINHAKVISTSILHFGSMLPYFRYRSTLNGTKVDNRKLRLTHDLKGNMTVYLLENRKSPFNVAFNGVPSDHARMSHIISKIPKGIKIQHGIFVDIRRGNDLSYLINQILYVNLLTEGYNMRGDTSCPAMQVTKHVGYKIPGLSVMFEKAGKLERELLSIRLSPKVASINDMGIKRSISFIDRVIYLVYKYMEHGRYSTDICNPKVVYHSGGETYYDAISTSLMISNDTCDFYQMEKELMTYYEKSHVSLSDNVQTIGNSPNIRKVLSERAPLAKAIYNHCCYWDIKIWNMVFSDFSL
jgi:hypothetical protein